MQLFHWNSCKILVFCSGFTRRSGLVRPASKSCRFSHHPLRVPKAWHRDFAACGQRSGLLALNLANIFEKLLDQKTFGCLRLVLEKPLAYSSARLEHIPSLPGNRSCPWNLVPSLQPSDFKGNCDSFNLLTDSCTVSFAPQMWAARPHLGSIFEKLLHRKTFSLPAARILQPVFNA